MKRTWIISLVLIACLLTATVGGTIAWFTDSVTSENNKIEAGNLDVALLMHTGNGYEDISESTAPIFGAGSLAQNNNAETLWEPGKTQIVYLGVENKGNLDLKYNIALNVVDAGLVGSLEYAVVNGAMADSLTAADWTALKAAAQTGDIVAGSTVAAPNGAIKAGEDVEYFALAVHMKEEAGNEYQNKSVTIDMTLRATQLASEYDSFDNQYDVNAPLSEWNGTVPVEMPKTLVVDGATQTVHVQDAAAFAYLSTLSEKWAEFYTDGQGTGYSNYANGAGANYYYSGQWTISLEADIDLKNHPIEPVSVVFGQATGASAFDGNNHVIRNVNTTTGLFADNSRISYADLTLENVKATNGALTGSSNTSITNVTVKNATISGADYVGGLVGYIYGGVINCKVVDSSVVGTKEVGGLIGYIASSSGTNEVKGNEVNNVTVYANNRAAGLVAQVNVGVKVYNNVIDTVTVGAEDRSKYQPDAVVSNALAPENVYDNTVVNATILDSFGMVEDVAELKTALTNGTQNIILKNDMAIDGDDLQLMDTNVGSTAQSVFSVIGDKDVTIDLNGKTITVDTAGGTNVWSVFYAGQNANLTVTGGRIEYNSKGRTGGTSAFTTFGSNAVITLKDVEVEQIGEGSVTQMIYAHGAPNDLGKIYVEGGTYIQKQPTSATNPFYEQGALNTNIIVSGGTYKVYHGVDLTRYMTLKEGYKLELTGTDADGAQWYTVVAE